jgi:hypothetical protein
MKTNILSSSNFQTIGIIAILSWVLFGIIFQDKIQESNSSPPINIIFIALFLIFVLLLITITYFTKEKLLKKYGRNSKKPDVWILIVPLSLLIILLSYFVISLMLITKSIISTKDGLLISACLAILAAFITLIQIWVYNFNILRSKDKQN